jgi:U3 small nucleolar RNA-associated protein 6
MEAMVPELEDCEKRGYFSRAEIRVIVKRRQQFEYSLRRRKPILTDFLRCEPFLARLHDDRLHGVRLHSAG